MTISALLVILICFLFGYFWGSIPFGLILTRLTGGGDLRAIGSGNIGATNVLRTGKKGVAAATLLLDLAKGAGPVLAIGMALPALPQAGLLPLGPEEAEFMQLSAQPMHLAGLGAFIGHLYPVWLKFRGGKGVATFIGILLALHWPLALIFCAIWLATALLTRIPSLSALVAALSPPVYYLVYGLPGLGFIALIGVLIYWKHRDNISRMLAGQETKIGAKS